METREENKLNSLSELIIYFDRDYLLLKPKQKIEILSIVLLYLFKLCKSAEMMDTINRHLEWSGKEGDKFRALLADCGNVQKNIKFYLYSRVVNGRAEAQNENPGIKIEDQIFVERMLGLKNRNILFMKKALRILAKSFPPRSIASFDRGVALAYAELKVTATKYVHKKFKFLTNSSQDDFDNLVSDMTHQAVYAIYRAYPEVENRMHMKNIGIRTIHNRGVNILKSQSTKSRKRMVKNDDGTFSGILLSFSHKGFEASQLEGSSGGVTLCNHLMVGLDGKPAPYESVRDVDRKRDLETTINQMATRLNTKKPRLFLDLLMGKYNRKFSDWLGRPNDEASDTMEPRRYSELCRQYLKIEVTDAKSFVTSLRKNLKDFRN